MTAMHERRRVGFTLVELLVVVAILGVLTAIGTGAYFRVRTGQQTKATEDTVSKLSAALAQQWAAERDMALDAFVGKGNTGAYSTQVENTKLIAAGDTDRARALWVYLWMKNAFPQTAAEATAATTMSVAISTMQTVNVSLPARSAYSTMSTGAGLPAGDQAAAILYLALTQKGTRGQVFNDEATGSLSVVLTGSTLRVFTDTFGNPIAYARMSSGVLNDANSAEYLKPGAASRDPIDQFGRLTNWPPPTVSPPATPPRVQAAGAFGLPDFTNTNWLYSVVSRGPEKTWGTFPTAVNGFIPIPDGFTAGYKLRRQGNRGDQ